MLQDIVEKLTIPGLPPWVALVLLVAIAVSLLAFLAMPFAVFGVKSRLEAIEARACRPAHGTSAPWCCRAPARPPRPRAGRGRLRRAADARRAAGGGFRHPHRPAGAAAGRSSGDAGHPRRTAAGLAEGGSRERDAAAESPPDLPDQRPEGLWTPTLGVMPTAHRVLHLERTARPRHRRTSAWREGKPAGWPAPAVRGIRHRARLRHPDEPGQRQARQPRPGAPADRGGGRGRPPRPRHPARDLDQPRRRPRKPARRGGGAARHPAARAAPAYEMLRGLARTHGITVHGGSIIEDGGDEAVQHDAGLRPGRQRDRPLPQDPPVRHHRARTAPATRKARCMAAGRTSPSSRPAASASPAPSATTSASPSCT